MLGRSIGALRVNRTEAAVLVANAGFSGRHPWMSDVVGAYHSGTLNTES